MHKVFTISGWRKHSYYLKWNPKWFSVPSWMVWTWLLQTFHYLMVWLSLSSSRPSMVTGIQVCLGSFNSLVHVRIHTYVCVCVCVCGTVELASGANVRQEGLGSVLLGLKHSGLVTFTHDIFYLRIWAGFLYRIIIIIQCILGDGWLSSDDISWLPGLADFPSFRVWQFLWPRGLN